MLRIRLDGSIETKKTLALLKKQTTDYKEYFETIVTPALFRHFEEIFDKEGAIGTSGKWKSLKASTLAEKKRKGLRLNILQRTGRLKDAYTNKNSYSRVLTDKKKLTYHNFVKYGIYHETGTSKGLPKRSVIARLIDYKEFKNDLQTGLASYLLENIGRK